MQPEAATATTAWSSINQETVSQLDILSYILLQEAEVLPRSPLFLQNNACSDPPK